MAALEREAARLGAERLHLLTATAADFFVRLGYRPAAREGAPAAIAATAQFAQLCPASAAYLVKTLLRRASRTAHASFVLDALEQALHERRPVQGGGLVHHSDRGVQGGFK